MISASRLSRGITATFAALALSVCAGADAGTSAAAGPPASQPLSHVVLARALPGFVLLPNGLFDGPIPKAMLDSYSNSAQWRHGVANGSLTGFVRAWSRTYQRGLALVYLTAIRLPGPADVPLFTSSIAALAAKQPDAATYAVSGLDGATGYRTNPPVQIGTVAGYWIIFTRGNTGFFLYAVVPPRSVTAAQLAGVARRQAAQGAGG